MIARLMLCLDYLEHINMKKNHDLDLVMPIEKLGQNSKHEYSMFVTVTLRHGWGLIYHHTIYYSAH